MCDLEDGVLIVDVLADVSPYDQSDGRGCATRVDEVYAGTTECSMAGVKVLLVWPWRFAADLRKLR